MAAIALVLAGGPARYEAPAGPATDGDVARAPGAWAVYLAIWALRWGFDRLGDLLAIPVLLFGPPLALLLFGLATVWAFRGFAPDKRA